MLLQFYVNFTSRKKLSLSYILVRNGSEISLNDFEKRDLDNGYFIKEKKFSLY